MIKTIILRTVTFTLLWLIISEADFSSLLYGAPFIISTVFITFKMDTPDQRKKINFLALIYFIPYFLFESLKGGLDVTKRALNPTKLDINPELIRYPIKLNDRGSRFFFTCLVSLLPGTLNVKTYQTEVLIHILDKQSKNKTLQLLKKSEQHVNSLLRHS